MKCNFLLVRISVKRINSWKTAAIQNINFRFELLKAIMKICARIFFENAVRINTCIVNICFVNEYPLSPWAVFQLKCFIIILFAFSVAWDWTKIFCRNLTNIFKKNLLRKSFKVTSLKFKKEFEVGFYVVWTILFITETEEYCTAFFGSVRKISCSLEIIKKGLFVLKCNWLTS